MEFSNGLRLSGTKLVMKTCFTYINLHSFRQTYARNMLDKGASKEVLQILLSHRSIKTTEIDETWVRMGEVGLATKYDVN